MEFNGFFYFEILALFITAAFSFLNNDRGLSGSFWTFFIVFFLAIWSADIWINSCGPHWNNKNFISLLAVGLIVALILAAVTPSPVTREIAEHEIQSSDKSYAAAVVSSSFFDNANSFTCSCYSSNFLLNV